METENRRSTPLTRLPRQNGGAVVGEARRKIRAEVERMSAVIGEAQYAQQVRAMTRAEARGGTACCGSEVDRKSKTTTV